MTEPEQLMPMAIPVACGLLFILPALAARRGGDKGGKSAFKVLRAFGAVCLSAILAIGNVAFAGNATFTGGERQATHATDGRIDIAYQYEPRDSYAGVGRHEINGKRGGGEWTYLHEEASRGNTRHIKELIKRGADIEIQTRWSRWTALHLAADKGHHNAVKALLKARAKTEVLDEEGKTPLHLAAAKKNNFPVVEALTDNRANVKAKDKQGRTPLHLAAQADRSRRDHIMERLLKKGADVDARDNDGRTPLHLAAQAGKIAAVRFLISKGRANRNAKDNNGKTVFQMAVDAGSTYVAERLVSEFKMNASFIHKRSGNLLMTPLHEAAKNNGKAIKPLLALGAKIEVKDLRGYTPLHFAARHNNAEATRVLIEKGADILAKNNAKERKQMPLHLAARYNGTDAAWHLLEADASPLLPDSENNTPLWIAKYHHGYFSGIAYLMRKKATIIGCGGRGTGHNWMGICF
ncbi:MAG: ankyrin repeat domain-containing protein [Gammaproteobacteria bacterium]